MSLVPLPLVVHTVCALSAWSSSGPLLSPRVARVRLRQLAPVRAAVALNSTEDEDDGWSEFFEVGGEYELDKATIKELHAELARLLGARPTTPAPHTAAAVPAAAEQEQH